MFKLKSRQKGPRAGRDMVPQLHEEELVIGEGIETWLIERDVTAGSTKRLQPSSGYSPFRTSSLWAGFSFPPPLLFHASISPSHTRSGACYVALSLYHHLIPVPVVRVGVEQLELMFQHLTSSCVADYGGLRATRAPCSRLSPPACASRHLQGPKPALSCHLGGAHLPRTASQRNFRAYTSALASSPSAQPQRPRLNYFVKACLLGRVGGMLPSLAAFRHLRMRGHELEQLRSVPR